MKKIEVQGYEVVMTDEEGNKEVLRCRTKRAAHAARAAIELGLEDENPLTFGEYVENRWRPYFRDHRLTADSRRTYEGVINNHLLPRFADVCLDDITPQVVKRYFDELFHAETKGLGLIQLVFSAVLGVAAKWRYITSNPFSKLTIWIFGCKRPDDIDPEDWKAA